MCGIVGYVGWRESRGLLLEALKKLVYRGYDSAGIAVADAGGKIAIVRGEGKIGVLENLMKNRNLPGCVGIAHTRWATHGRPSVANAHPQSTGRVTLVHNGIIENFSELKEELLAAGRKFESETDTEIVAHLIDMALEKTHDPLHAVHTALRRIRGSYALVVLCEPFTDRIILAKNQSPLVIARKDGEVFAASDVAALLSESRDVIYLEDGDTAVLTADAVRIFDDNHEEVCREVKTLNWDPDDAEKSGYKHFMLKEINEQPARLTDTLRGRLFEDDIALEELAGLDLEHCKRIVMVACGTSYYAALCAKTMIETLCDIPAEIDFASEFRYRNPIVRKGDLFVAVSQSGETADTLSCIRMVKRFGVKVLSICNVMGSTMTRLSDAVLYTRANIEIGVCSTKAFTTQLCTLLLFAVGLGRRRKTLKDEEFEKIGDALRKLPQQTQHILDKQDDMIHVAQSLLRSSSFLFLGRGVHFPIALEGALKLKEISYIHAEAYPAGEMKHGPIALIDDKLPVIVVAPQNATYEKTCNNLQEVRARGGRIVAVVSEDDTKIASVAEHVFRIPKSHPLAEPMLTVIPLQLLAYHIADLLGNDVDQPRNLAKSVTVE